MSLLYSNEVILIKCKSKSKVVKRSLKGNCWVVPN